MFCNTIFCISCLWFLGLGKPEKEPFRGGEQEPWIHRSGIFGEFRVSCLTVTCNKFAN